METSGKMLNDVTWLTGGLGKIGSIPLFENKEDYFPVTDKILNDFVSTL